MKRCTLVLDASTYTGTIAIVRADGSVVEGEAPMRGAQEEHLMPAIAETMMRGDVKPGELTDVVCGGGPGSFTSLRIAAAIAKGICAARNVRLSVVSSLALLVAAESRPAGRYVAALDAMRGEFYVQLFVVGADGVVHEDGERERVAKDALAAFAASHGAELLANSALGASVPHARGILRVAPELVREVDLATWEPDYGRLAEAQVKWEAAHGRALTSDRA